MNELKKHELKNVAGGLFSVTVIRDYTYIVGPGGNMILIIHC